MTMTITTPATEPRADTISMLVVQTLVQAVSDAGVPRAAFLHEAALDADELADRDAKLPQSKLYELFALALELTGDPAFGLHAIERLPSEAIDSFVARSATLRDAMHTIQGLRSILADDASFVVYEEGEQVIVRANSRPELPLPVRRLIAEGTVAGLHRIIKRFGGDARIEYAAFDYGVPDYQDEYQRIFEGGARFDQALTGLCFDRALLTAAAPQAFARKRPAHRNPRGAYAARVLEVLVEQQPPRDMTMQRVAHALGVSVRSLRRYLTAEGKSYATLQSQAQASIAKTCLLDERRTILDTAFELGFADKTGFHRAFKRWTGLTPLEYRRQQSQNAGAH